MNVLHDYNYDIGKALMSLITENGPIINKDQIEDWSVNEANLFEDALEKLGKDFVEIRREFVSSFDHSLDQSDLGSYNGWNCCLISSCHGRR